MELNDSFLNDLKETYPAWAFRYWRESNPSLYCKRVLTRYNTEYYADSGPSFSFRLEKFEELTDLLSQIKTKVQQKEEEYPTNRRILTEYCHEWGTLEVYDFKPDRVDDVLMSYMTNQNIKDHFDGLKSWKAPKEVNLTIDESWPDNMKREAENALKSYQRELKDYNSTQELLKDYQEACDGNTVSAASIILAGDPKNWYPYLQIELDYLK